jgi:hypothetical protein
VIFIKTKSVAHDIVIMEMMTHLLTLKIWWLYMALSAKLCWPNDHTQQNGDPSITAAEEDKRPLHQFFIVFHLHNEKLQFKRSTLRLCDPSCRMTYQVLALLLFLFLFIFQWFFKTIFEKAFLTWHSFTGLEQRQLIVGTLKFCKIGFSPYLLILHSIFCRIKFVW